MGSTVTAAVIGIIVPMGECGPKSQGRKEKPFPEFGGKLLEELSTRHTDLSLTFLPWKPFCSPLSPGAVWVLSLAPKAL